MQTRTRPADLRGKVIDVHSHVGISIKACAMQEFPSSESLEGLYYRQLAGGVDVNVVFPTTMDLYLDPRHLVTGKYVPAEKPVSPVPFAVENEYLLLTVYDFCSELRDRFLPFVCADPGREAAAQAGRLRALADAYPIYGMKISPVLCQSHVTELLAKGSCLLELAREQDWPVLLHTTVHEDESFSHARLAFVFGQARI